ncbi:Transmembrane protein 267 [Frankliniella fusca]|uniref:Transmembrane protein 267 n=1 Tax=Frankliniella fusca TaxID=407009 RepID=A0AAE1LCY3_9NEOP|nr:Transmembrane protein 267 [Frankliniella fusca]
MISEVFSSDPVYNIHHKRKDFDQLGTSSFTAEVTGISHYHINGRTRFRAHLSSLRESTYPLWTERFCNYRNGLQYLKSTPR